MTFRWLFGLAVAVVLTLVLGLADRQASPTAQAATATTWHSKEVEGKTLSATDSLLDNILNELKASCQVSVDPIDQPSPDKQFGFEVIYACP